MQRFHSIISRLFFIVLAVLCAKSVWDVECAVERFKKNSISYSLLLLPSLGADYGNMECQRVLVGLVYPTLACLGALHQCI